jgi:hypothetical protein
LVFITKNIKMHEQQRKFAIPSFSAHILDTLPTTLSQRKNLFMQECIMWIYWRFERGIRYGD